MKKAVPLTVDNVREQLTMNLKELVSELPKYTLKVGIPGTKASAAGSIAHYAAINEFGTFSGHSVPITVILAKLNNSKHPMKNKFLAIFRAKLAKGQKFFWARIPSRPFMRTTFQGESMYIIHMKAAKLLKDICLGQSNAKLFLEQLGLVVAGQIQKNIMSYQFKPNSLLTQVLKSSSHPLMDTGTMRRAITAWVTQKRAVSA